MNALKEPNLNIRGFPPSTSFAGHPRLFKLNRFAAVNKQLLPNIRTTYFYDLITYV